jgi:hypothetical protein
LSDEFAMQRIEKIYARHLVWPGKRPFHPPAPKEARE